MHFTLLKAKNLSRNLSTKPVATAVYISILGPKIVVHFRFITAASHNIPLVCVWFPRAISFDILHIPVDDFVVGPPTPQNTWFRPVGIVATTKNNNPKLSLNGHIYKTAPNGLFVTVYRFLAVLLLLSRFSLYDGKQLSVCDQVPDIPGSDHVCVYLLPGSTMRVLVWHCRFSKQNGVPLVWDCLPPTVHGNH